jgi:hypothetical protein
MLGAPHDNDVGCPIQGYIMDAFTDVSQPQNTSTDAWSNCSTYYIQTYMNSACAARPAAAVAGRHARPKRAGHSVPSAALASGARNCMIQGTGFGALPVSPSAPALLPSLCSDAARSSHSREHPSAHGRSHPGPHADAHQCSAHASSHPFPLADAHNCAHHARRDRHAKRGTNRGADRGADGRGLRGGLRRAEPRHVHYAGVYSAHRRALHGHPA